MIILCDLSILKFKSSEVNIKNIISIQTFADRVDKVDFIALCKNFRMQLFNFSWSEIFRIGLIRYKINKVLQVLR